MARARIALVALVALSSIGAPLGPTAVAPASPLRPIEAGGVVALVPRAWEARELASPLRSVAGVQASANLDGWAASNAGATGVEAYWVDATLVGVPSDFYRTVASGPALDALPAGRGCRADARHVWTERARSAPPPLAASDYLATATGTCRSRGGTTRWGAFVAAPGFGAARPLGIARSGLYFAFVSVREGPNADAKVNRILTSVTFGETPVREFLRAVGAPGAVA